MRHPASALRLDQALSILLGVKIFGLTILLKAFKAVTLSLALKAVLKTRVLSKVAHRGRLVNLKGLAIR